MKENLSITSHLRSGEEIRLMTINEYNLEDLRLWKNSEKSFFFYKHEISIIQQAEWYQNYCLRDEDFIFIIEYSSQFVGCIGIRKINLNWDIYNVILGNKKFQKMGIMTVALKELINFFKIRHQLNVSLQVLKINPAVDWYLKNNFHIKQEEHDHFVMEYII